MEDQYSKEAFGLGAHCLSSSTRDACNQSKIYVLFGRGDRHDLLMSVYFVSQVVGCRILVSKKVSEVYITIWLIVRANMMQLKDLLNPKAYSCVTLLLFKPTGLKITLTFQFYAIPYGTIF